MSGGQRSRCRLHSIGRLSAQDRVCRLRCHRRHAVHAASAVTWACRRSSRLTPAPSRSSSRAGARIPHHPHRSHRHRQAGRAHRESPSGRLHASSTTASRRKSTAPNGARTRRRRSGRSRPRARSRTTADEERAAQEPGTRLIALYLDEYHVSAGESTERVRARRVPLHRRAGAPGRSPRGHEAARPPDGDPLHPRSRRGAEGRQQLQRAPQRLHAALAVRGAVSRPVARRGARRARADRDVRLARAGDQDGGSQGRALGHRADERGVHRPTCRARASGDCPISRDSCARRAGSACCCTPSIPTRSRRLRRTPPRPMPTPTSNRHRCSRAWRARPVEMPSARVRTSAGPAARLEGSRFVLCADVHLDERERRALPQRSDHVEPAATRRCARDPATGRRFRASCGRHVSPCRRLMTMRALKRSPFIDSWFGLTVEPDGRRRIIFTWTSCAAPASSRSRPVGRPDVVALKVTTPTGTVLFEGEVGPARPGNTSSLRPDSAVFQTMPGRLQFDLTILQADGSKLDVGAQDFDVPEVRGANPVILPPQMFRAASAREFRDISADANAAPLPGREFRRTERLLLRVPTFEPAASGPGIGKARQPRRHRARRPGADARRGGPDADPVRSAAGELRARRVLDRSGGPERRRNRPRADSLPDHRVTVSLLAYSRHALSHPLLLFLLAWQLQAARPLLARFAKGGGTFRQRCQPPTVECLYLPQSFLCGNTCVRRSRRAVSRGGELGSGAGSAGVSGS